MEPGAYSVVSAALLQQRNLETITNNLANATTVGFKAEVATFQIQEKEIPLEENFPLGGKAVQRSEWSNNHIKFTQGALRRTAAPLDVALTGPGFFVLQSPDGLRYTRSGQFQLNGQGEIISKDGWQVLGKGGTPIRLTAAQSFGGVLNISENGLVTDNGQRIGELEVVNFTELSQLSKVGHSAFAPVDSRDQGTPVQAPKTLQGYVEESNVVIVSELVRLIETARLYESYQKILQSFDEADDRSINDLGRIQGTA